MVFNGLYLCKYTKFSNNTNTSTASDSWGSNWWGDRVAYYKICDKAGNCTEKTTPVKKGIYTVSYSACSGSGAPGSQTKYYGTDLTISNQTPTRTGYEFLGWATDSCNGSPVKEPEEKYSSNADVTFYAVWKLNRYDKTETGTYTITPTSNGFSCGTMQMRISWKQVYKASTNSSDVSVTNVEGNLGTCTGVYWVGGEKNEGLGIFINGTRVKEMIIFAGTHSFSIWKTNTWGQLYVNNLSGSSAVQGGDMPYSTTVTHTADDSVSVPIKVQVYWKKSSGATPYAYFNNTFNTTLQFD